MEYKKGRAFFLFYFFLTAELLSVIDVISNILRTLFMDSNLKTVQVIHFLSKWEWIAFSIQVSKFGDFLHLG